VNFDLIYGLAKQTPELMEKTVDLTIALGPDRIALYSFALVPWIKPAHRLFKDEDLPTGQAKRALYELARTKFLAAGYVEIGMDHFARPTDSLARALRAGKLHRNFMGYTDHRTELLLGLGVSSISETPLSFHQNEKLIPQYETQLAAGRIPTTRGHVLDTEDRRRREQILALMTRYEVELEDGAQAGFVREFLGEMLRDGLVQIEGLRLRVTESGKPFLRNACVVFDERLRRRQPGTRIFSSSL
jgi:oxygen-independent coproporphyrinogen-3 oxidase